MENLLKTIEQFLEFSDEKLEELSRKNQALKLEETKKERESMRKLLFLLLLPAFFTAKVVVSTEQDVELTAKQQYEITSTTYSNYYTDLPTNPNVYEQIPTYTSLNLEKLLGV